MVANEADFWTRERHAASELVAELIVEAGAAIDGNGISRGLFLHSLIIA